ncbi:hypothetical protein K7432_012149 [Basidiobolus ranarum]|uniref:CUE domain-containing protein n=1 Tax=Basidiobolus ranarum TaxID=34480 RepID=A0ABR2WLD4_9FUNG
MDLSTKLEGLGLSEEEEKHFKEIDTPLKFLKVCFPTYDDEHLISKLEACDGDIESTVDVISNDELRNLEIFGAEVDSFAAHEETPVDAPTKPLTEPSKRQYNTPGNFSKSRRQQRENRPKLRQPLKKDDFPDLLSNNTSASPESLPSLISPPQQYQPKSRQVFKKDDFPDLLSSKTPVISNSASSSTSQQLPPPLPSVESSTTLRHQEEFEEDLSQLASIFPDHDLQSQGEEY